MSVALLAAVAAQPPFRVSATSVVHLTSSSSGSTSTGSAVTTEGGKSPFTYSCVRIGGAPQISANTPTASSTTFAFSLPFEGFYVATFRWTVTDDDGLVATTDVTVTVNYFI